MNVSKKFKPGDIVFFIEEPRFGGQPHGNSLFSNWKEDKFAVVSGSSLHYPEITEPHVLLRRIGDLPARGNEVYAEERGLASSDLGDDELAKTMESLTGAPFDPNELELTEPPGYKSDAVSAQSVRIAYRNLARSIARANALYIPEGEKFVIPFALQEVAYAYVQEVEAKDSVTRDATRDANTRDE